MSKPVTRWVLTGVGPDKPGIVAGLTQVLFAHGANIEESAMTQLANEFAMILIVSLPTEAEPLLAHDKLQQDFSKAAKALNITLSVRPLDVSTALPIAVETTPYLLTISGADQAGLTAQFAQLLAELSVNISNLQATRLTHGDAGPVYLMQLEVALPVRGKPSSEHLAQRLQALASKLSVEVRLAPVDVALC